MMTFIYTVSVVLAVGFYAALITGIVWIVRKSRPSAGPPMDVRWTGAVLAAALLATLATFGPASCGALDQPLRKLPAAS